MVLPKIRSSESWSRTSVTLPVRTWTKLKTTMEAVNVGRAGPERYSRDKLMAELIDWACEEMLKTYPVGGRR